MMETQQMQANEQHQPATSVPKPISQMDKLKLMIIRIGDEKRECRDDHLQKLKTQLNSAFVMKDKNNRQTLVEVLLTCIKCMPHKVNLYSYLMAAISVEDFEFAQEITVKVVECLNECLTKDGDVFASKNCMRILGNLVQIGLISSEAFCQLLLQIVEDYSKLQGAHAGTGCQTHSTDLILETILAAMPLTQQKLQREQSIDFGTVIESLKSMFKEREKVRMLINKDESDLLMKTWEAIFQNTNKLFTTDRVLLSASRQSMLDLVKAVQVMGRQIQTLPQIFLTEFTESKYAYTLSNLANKDFQKQRLRRYRSPVLLPIVTSINDKFESVLAVDVAMAIFKTFADSQQMCAQNLLNLYLAEELKEAMSEVLLSCLFSLLLSHERPFTEPPLFFAVLLNQMVNSSREIESLKKLKSFAEEKFSKQVFAHFNNFTYLQQERIIAFLGTYLSQASGRDLGLAEPFLLKLTENAMSDGQKAALRKVFVVVCSFVFVKKARDQLDSQFHQYLPSENGQENILDEAECQIILDALMAKESSEKLLEIVEQHNLSVFAKCMLARTKKSLEHLKTSVDRYRLVFDKLYSGNNQKILLEQVFVVFDNEPDKALKAVQKICQIGLVQNLAVVEFACNQLAGKPRDSLEFALITQALQRSSLAKWLTSTRFIQKPPTSEDTPQIIDEMQDDEAAAAEKEERANRMTLAQYQSEFASKLSEELNVFKGSIDRLVQLNSPVVERFIVDLYRQIETPFLTLESDPQKVAVPKSASSELKQMLSCL